MTSFFAWNVRGFNKMRKHKNVRTWINSARPAFGCLLETRVHQDRCQEIITTTFPGWKHLTNYDFHRLGRIWFVWSEAVDVEPLSRCSQSITVRIRTVSGDYFLCSCVYASNFQRERLLLWDELSGVKDQYNSGDIPWIILGDFNVTISSSEHSHPFDYVGDQTGMRDFQDFVSNNEVSDLDYTGPTFTWWNNRVMDPI